MRSLASAVFRLRDGLVRGDDSTLRHSPYQTVRYHMVVKIRSMVKRPHLHGHHRHRPRSPHWDDQWQAITSAAALSSLQNSTAHPSQRLPLYEFPLLLPLKSCADRRRHAPVARQALFFSSCITVLGLPWRTRAISRIPRPLRLISTIVRLPSGQLPGSVELWIHVTPVHAGC